MLFRSGIYSIHATLFDDNTVLSMVENASTFMIVARGDGLAQNVAGFSEIEGVFSLTESEDGPPK